MQRRSLTRAVDSRACAPMRTRCLVSRGGDPSAREWLQIQTELRSPPVVQPGSTTSQQPRGFGTPDLEEISGKEKQMPKEEGNSCAGLSKGFSGSSQLEGTQTLDQEWGRSGVVGLLLLVASLI